LKVRTGQHGLKFYTSDIPKAWYLMLEGDSAEGVPETGEREATHRTPGYGVGRGGEHPVEHLLLIAILARKIFNIN